MRTLVLLSVIAAALAMPNPQALLAADCDDDAAVVAAAPVAYAGAAHFGLAAGAPLSYAAAAPAAQAAYAGVAHFGLAAGAHLPYAAAAPAAHVAYAAAPAAPVAYAAAPAAHVAYAAAPVPVALPPKEVQVPITRTHVQVPLEKKIHYGVQHYVSGTQIAVHKTDVTAPPIAPPSVLLSKVTHNAPEVTVKTQEVNVDKFSPNYVEQPYHAGTIVKYTEPEVKEVSVPTPVAKPVAVAQPYAVPQPFAVPEPVPVPVATPVAAVHAAVPAVHAAVPAIHAGVPAVHAAVPAVHTAVPAVHAAVPAVHAAVPAVHAAVPAVHAAVLEADC